VLNRLYIVIGVLAIVTLGAGFIVPRWIDWGQYRDRLETLAQASLGADVAIGGEIDLTLLPQPRMRFGKTIIGPPGAPFLQVDNIVADFSLMDFLRNRLTITQLVMEAPKVNLRIDENGAFNVPFAFPQTLTASNISVASAKIKAGLLALSDARTGQAWEIAGFEGSLRISGGRGPFGLQGRGMLNGQSVEVRVNTSAANAAGGMQVSLFLRPQNGAFSFSGEGLFSGGKTPGFKGKITYRSTPSASDSAQGAQGDFVINSEAEFTAQKLLLSSFTIQPDENRPGTRLSGAAVVRLGAVPEFDAVISGGVLALPPPDLREDKQEIPYALVHLLGEMPAPFVPSIAGRIGVDIAELDLRSFALRKVRIDATTDGKSWNVADFSGTLPGNSLLTLSGRVSEVAGKLAYQGTLKLKTSRLDALARLWRREENSNPLFNIQASLAADIGLGNGKLQIANGKFTLDKQVHDFAGQLQLSGERNALISARFKPMNARQSRALLAVLPDFPRDTRFNVTFPTGSLDVAAEKVTLFDLEGKNLALQMDWGNQGLKIVRASAQDLGGARLSLSGNLAGSLSRPLVSGNGRITLTKAAGSGFLAKVSALAGWDKMFADPLARSLPLNATFKLDPLDENQGQKLSAGGKAGVGEFQISVGVADRISNFARAPLLINASIQSDQPDALSAQLGLGAKSLLPPDKPVAITMIAQGTLLNSLETTIVAQGGGDRVGFAGTLIMSDLANLRGRGLLDFSLSDPAPMLEMMGMGGVHLGSIEGTSNINFAGGQTLSVQNIVANAKGAKGAAIAGQLIMAQNGDTRLVTGQLDIGAIEVNQLLALMGGPAALVAGSGFWPEGPIDLGPAMRSTRGRVAISTPAINADGRTLISDAGFQFTWDATGVALANIAGSNGAGSISGSVELCCAALNEQKQLSGRLSLNGVPVQNILPAALSADLKGTIDAGVQIQATGASVAQMMKTLSGEGSFAITDLEVAKFDPAVFTTLANLKNITELDKDALTSIVALALEKGNFKAPLFSGIFQLAAGSLRAANLAAEGSDARLLGDIGVNFSDLSISGKWSLTPSKMDNHIGLINQNTAQVSAILAGSLNAPKRQLELGAMIDSIQVRALEIELSRLERVRAEEEARSAAAAAQRAKAMELEARLKAEEAVRLAEEEKVHQLADGNALALDVAPEKPAPTNPAPTNPAPTNPPPPPADPAVTDLLSGQ